ncbi:MAG TPA: 16S rRNA (guanine(527)-N(7))-methyltransferase RsmG [Burkholderiales bacterium]|nr:16S rRNA (guanine(527)-N(7))-methyltransferase RsmG [Burkholderiales bacterium]
MSAGEALAHGAAELHLALSSDIRERLMRYLALLKKWNKVYNLTAVQGEQEMVSRHLLDSLAVVPYVEARSILDVGSGAGLPGIPLALALPRSQVSLLDANQKKAAFLRQAAIELGLENVHVVCERVETWQTHERFEIVISRAFSDLRKFLMLAGRLCAEGGTMAAMQGTYAQDQFSRFPREFRLNRVVPLKVPGMSAQRHLVLMQSA